MKLDLNQNVLVRSLSGVASRRHATLLSKLRVLRFLSPFADGQSAGVDRWSGAWRELSPISAAGRSGVERVAQDGGAVGDQGVDVGKAALFGLAGAGDRVGLDQRGQAVGFAGFLHLQVSLCLLCQILRSPKEPYLEALRT